ncbi:MAG: ribonuclease HII [Thermodesulfobacteriota bacterium]
MDTWESKLSLEGFSSVAGVDEAGRGPLAGPVVAAAVILKDPLPLDSGIIDSKKLSPKTRDRLLSEIHDSALCIAIGLARHDEVDSINIHCASLLAMERAVSRLAHIPDFLLIDGKFTIDNPLRQEAIISGDNLSISIAAASIVAKTMRDKIMITYEKIYPGYGFASHKGYGTKAHMDAIKTLGPCPIHRKTFKGVLK